VKPSRRRVHRSDLNAGPLLALARKLGFIVQVIGKLVDWLLWEGSNWQCVEIKSTGGKYTPNQKAFLALCASRNAPVLTWYCEQQIIDYANTIRRALQR